MKLEHPLLRKVADQVTANVPRQLDAALNNAVMAGNRIMNDPKGQKLFDEHMKQKLPPHELAGEGAAKLVAIIFSHSRGKLPLRVLIPAGVVLTLMGLEFMLDAGVFDDITPQDVDQAIKEYSSAVLQVLGVSPKMMQQMLLKGTQIMAERKGGAPQQPPQPQQPQPPGGIIASQQGV